MLDEIVVRAVTAVSRRENEVESTATRRRGIRSQDRLVDLIENGEVAEAEEHWRSHMSIVSRVMLGQDSETVIDLLHHQD
jgi:GntR family transcriptional repressor for pyruvate dehydrogenase complex